MGTAIEEEDERKPAKEALLVFSIDLFAVCVDDT